MKLFGLYVTRKKPLSPDAVKYVVVADPKQPDTQWFRLHGFRYGMWVTGPDGVGVLKNVDKDSKAHVALVNEDGTNRLDMLYLASELRQATYEEIPASRREMGREAFARMGYV